MIRTNDHKQIPFFDPWDFLNAKCRKMLEDFWAGLFQQKSLRSLLKEVAIYVHNISAQKSLLQKLKHAQAHIAEGKKSYHTPLQPFDMKTNRVNSSADLKENLSGN